LIASASVDQRHSQQGWWQNSHALCARYYLKIRYRPGATGQGMLSHGGAMNCGAMLLTFQTASS
jgi:hypothetical protein